ncbi:MAG: primase [Acidimicrobiaceae bacterium]|nr:primase [Acidimicrobiaceae bacterium]MDQ1416299.1 primase [Acidimicrobiaceae bacterium]
MGIVDEDVARVREETDFVAVASEKMALRKVGTRWTGLCPFHPEKTASFSLNAEQGFYYCFGCGAKGDVITFVREIDQLDFVEAVESLAARAGIGLHYSEGRAGREHQQKAQIYEALERAIEWYHQRLLKAPDAAAARRYLRAERGYDADVVRYYRLGWAPEGFDHLVKALDVGSQVLRDAGLATVNRAGRLNDSFRARLLFPIFDAAAKPVGLGGRILPGSELPNKYKNTEETAVYKKSRVLYGLNWAKKAVVDAGEVVVCEGYTDVIGFHRAGVPQAVATCGTALAEGHVRLLTNFAHRVVLAYDADNAGLAAAERFYDWERKFEVDVAVAALPKGLDPADLSRRDPEALRAAVTGARPFLAFRLDRVLERADLRSIEGRARTAARAMEVVAEHPSEIVRDQYLMVVADRCRVDPQQLRSGAWKSWGNGAGGAGSGAAGATGRGGRGPSAGGGAGGNATRGAVAGRADGSAHDVESRAEREALRLLVHRPEAIAGRLGEVLFEGDLSVRAYRARTGASNLYEAIAGADPDVADLLQRFAVEDANEDVDAVMIELIDRAGKRALAELDREARRSSRPQDYGAVIGWLKHALEDVRNGQSGLDGESPLVAWLVSRFEVADE